MNLLAHRVVSLMLDEELDPGEFVDKWLMSQFTDKKIIAVYEYIRTHQNESDGCPDCDATGEIAGALCDRCLGDGVVPAGDYREIVGLWNDAGKELSDLKAKLAQLGVTIQDSRIRKLFDYMNRNVGTGVYREVVKLSMDARRDINNAIIKLKRLTA